MAHLDDDEWPWMIVSSWPLAVAWQWVGTMAIGSHYDTCCLQIFKYIIASLLLLGAGIVRPVAYILSFLVIGAFSSIIN